MSIFQRMGDLLKANINDVLNKAEDPEKMVKQIIIDMEEQMRSATQSLGQAMGSEKQAFKQLETAKKTSQEWEAKARMAIQAGNQELAKKALANKVTSDSSIAGFEASYQTIHAQTAELKSRVEILRGKLEEARARQNMLIARANMAQVQKNIAATVSGTNTDSAFSKLDKMERKIEGQESEAEAFSEMSGDTSFARDEFKEMETDHAVDAELARLMKEMNP